jgi:ribosomal-protein-alanine N-acetyltransferase
MAVPLRPPTLDLAGARLRPLRAADADDLLAYLRHPAVTERTSFPEPSRALAEAIVDRAAARWAAGEPAKWGLTLPGDDRVVGTCGFADWSAAHRWAELAYDLAPDHWGRGLMGRAVAAAVGWVFGHDLAHRVHAYVRADNERSARLLERGGFAREGCLRGFRVCRGRPHDFHVYGLLRPDWAAAQPPPVQCPVSPPA